MRIVKIRVIPTIYLDDGENLTEMSIEPLDIPGSEVEEFAKTGLKEALDKLGEQVDNF